MNAVRKKGIIAPAKAQVFEYYVYGSLMAMLGASFMMKPILCIVVPADYVDAAALIPIIMLAYFFFSMHEHFKVPVILTKQTTNFLPVFCGAALINLAANLILIPTLGTAGAAWASVLTFMCFSFGGLALYRRIEKIDYPLGRCAFVTVGIILTYLGCVCVDRFLPSSSMKVAVAGGSWLAWSVFLFRRPLTHLLAPSLLAVHGKPVTHESLAPDPANAAE